MRIQAIIVPSAEARAVLRVRGASMMSPRRPRRVVTVLIVVGLIAAAGSAAVWWSTRRADPSAAYRTEPAAMIDISQTLSANGTLNPVTLVNVGTQVSGTVQTLLADFNDHVTAGQILLKLDPSILRAVAKQSEGSLANARASLVLAKANEARARAVFAKSFISRQDYEQTLEALRAAQAQVRLAEGQVEQSHTNLAYSVIRSPVAGVVVERTVDVGQTVAASFQTPTLFRIAKDLKDMQIDSSFAEADIGQIHPGQSVNFTVDAFPRRAFSASVRQVRLNPTTQQNVVTYDVVVGVQNTDEVLMPGMTAYVNVTVAQRHHVLAIPAAALRFRPSGDIGGPPSASSGADSGAATIYVIGKDRLEKRVINTGISDGKHVEVTSGQLAEGEKVVIGSALPAASTQSSSTIRVRTF